MSKAISAVGAIVLAAFSAAITVTKDPPAWVVYGLWGLTVVATVAFVLLLVWPRVSAALKAFRYPEIVSPKPPEAQPNTAHQGFYWPKKVRVFTHQSAIHQNPDLPSKVEELFTRFGWTVTLGRTDLERHREGIWVIGGDDGDKSLIACAVSTLGLKTRNDDAQQSELQVVVGDATSARVKANTDGLGQNLAPTKALHAVGPAQFLKRWLKSQRRR